MTQTEMIEKLSETTGLSKYRLRKIFLDLSKIFTDTLKEGGSVSIAGIGKLVTVDTKARKCINPQTLESISVKANKRVKFKVSNTLKKEIRI